MVRTQITMTDYVTLATAKVKEFVLAKKTFTAYNVTRELRAANPTLDIPHNVGVKARADVYSTMGALVANVMAPYIMDGQYERNTRTFNTRQGDLPAVVYSPVRIEDEEEMEEDDEQDEDTFLDTDDLAALALEVL